MSICSAFDKKEPTGLLKDRGDGFHRPQRPLVTVPPTTSLSPDSSLLPLYEECSQKKPTHIINKDSREHYTSIYSH